jgi:hypothetical protein
MKNTFKFLGIAAIMLAIVFSLSTCDDSGGKVVAPKYRFTGGYWRGFPNMTEWSAGTTVNRAAVSALGETTLTVTGGGVNISYTGVYTTEVGVFQFSNNEEWSIANLYDGSGKIGLACVVDGTWYYVFLGKSCVDNVLNFTGKDTTGMQDVQNGQARKD